jgi:valyl-tRNA synthetase
VFAHSSDSIERVMLASQVPTIIGMVKGCSAVSAVENAKEVPEGCGSQVLSSSLTIYILVKVRKTKLLLLCAEPIPLPTGQGRSR